ncbi:class I adenylate-forming enzyme family protein [Streptomyces sp. PU_AKi4]|uniref:class I adenylate-forming enzyme family protein n=1 Tax=Streptomyces sp. PU_AKi4 TaxID=2800809 RepID=UPI003525F6F5
MDQRAQGELNIGMLFSTYAARHQQAFVLDRPFDIAPERGVDWTLSGLADLVAEASGWLHASGVRPGDSVAVIKRNHYDIVLLAAGAARIGAFPAMISAQVPPKALRVMLDRLRPRTVLASADVLQGALDDGVDLGGPGTRLVSIGEPPNGTDADTLAVFQGAPVPPPSPVADDRPMIATHTSGTTGVPKLVVHSADTLCREAPYLERKRWAPWTPWPKDVVVNCTAFNHGRNVSWTSGMLACPSQEIVLISDADIENVARVLQGRRPTLFEAHPNMYQLWEDIVRTHPEIFSRVRQYISTFDAIHPRTVRRFLNASRRRMPLWSAGWGQSETAAIAFSTYTRRSMRKVGPGNPALSSGGRRAPRARVKVANSAAEPHLARGEVGIIFVRTASRCINYLGEEDRWKAKAASGWWNTGDLGRLDGRGRITLVDREVDRIPGISCIEAEGILLERLDRAHEVIILPNAQGLPIPVVSVPDGKLADDEWKRACAGLPVMDEPRLISWEDIPRTSTWKVRRLELRERVAGDVGGFGTGLWT